jgi:hypothetical protein
MSGFGLFNELNNINNNNKQVSLLERLNRIKETIGQLNALEKVTTKTRESQKYYYEAETDARKQIYETDVFVIQDYIKAAADLAKTTTLTADEKKTAISILDGLPEPYKSGKVGDIATGYTYPYGSSSNSSQAPFVQGTAEAKLETYCVKPSLTCNSMTSNMAALYKAINAIKTVGGRRKRKTSKKTKKTRKTRRVKHNKK